MVVLAIAESLVESDISRKDAEAPGCTRRVLSGVVVLAKALRRRVKSIDYFSQRRRDAKFRRVW